MPNFNKVILCGNLTREVETRYTAKGTAVAQMGLAINRKWTDESGEKKEEVTFCDLVAFNKTAEICAQYLKKGNPVLFEGRLKTDSWDDKTTGQKRSKLTVVVESVQFLSPASQDADNPQSERGGDPNWNPRPLPPRGPDMPRTVGPGFGQASALPESGFDPDQDVPF